MLKEVFKIDENGYIIYKFVVRFDEQDKPIQDLSKDIITLQPQSFYKERWNGVEWVETLTQAEIKALNDVFASPALENRLDSAENTILKILFM